MAHLEDLIQFLTPDSRMDLKSAACMTVAQLTGTTDGLALLSSHPVIITAAVHLLRDPEIYTAKDAMRTLVNVSAEDAGTATILAIKEVDVVTEMVKCIEDKDYIHADFACAVLANMCKSKHFCQQVFERIDKGSVKLEGLVFVLCQMNYNTKGAKLNLLAPCITNFTQITDVRRQLLDRKSLMMQRLIPFMEYKESKGRRSSIISAIHNCCFDKENHMWLMGEDIDLVPRLVLPLAGPDVFTSEENDTLPVDLQYLGDDKEREPDPEIRKLLLESVMQLCITRPARELMRSQNIYLVLREHHKWEEDRQCIMLNEDLVNILVRTEAEIGVEDLSTVDVSSEQAEKFTVSDREYLAGDLSDMKAIKDDKSSKDDEKSQDKSEKNS